MRFKGIVAITIAVLAVTGCSGNVKDRQITEENKEKLFDEIKATKDLTVEEVGLLQAYVVRKGLGDVLAGKTPTLPVGMTIGGIINEQRKWIDDEKVREEAEKQKVAQAKAEEERQSKQLLDAIALTVFDKGYAKEDYQDYITIRTRFENTSGKDIRGFQGAVVFSDLFGSEIMPFRISEDVPLRVGESRRQGWNLKYNQFIDKHTKIRNTELANMKVEWKPEVILFADGTSLRVGQ